MGLVERGGYGGREREGEGKRKVKTKSQGERKRERARRGRDGGIGRGRGSGAERGGGQRGVREAGRGLRFSDMTLPLLICRSLTLAITPNTRHARHALFPTPLARRNLLDTTVTTAKRAASMPRSFQPISSRGPRAPLPPSSALPVGGEGGRVWAASPGIPHDNANISNTSADRASLQPSRLCQPS